MNIVKSIFKFNILLSIVLFVVGLILIIWPSQIITIISNIIGAILLIIGASNISNYLKYRSNYDLVSGVITIVAGLVLLINPSVVISVLPFILGIFFIISGISKITYAFDIFKDNRKNYSSLIMSILIILCGVLLVINPFKGAVHLTQIMGGYILFYSVLNIVNYYTIKKYTKQIESVIINDKRYED